MKQKMNPVNWFEIPVKNFDQAKRFYESVFDFDLPVTDMGLAKMAWFPMSPGVPGAGGGLICSEDHAPSATGTLVFFHVDDIDGTLAKIKANGGQTLMPKRGIGEHGFIAQFKDCEGNRVALHSKK